MKRSRSGSDETKNDRTAARGRRRHTTGTIRSNSSPSPMAEVQDGTVAEEDEQMPSEADANGTIERVITNEQDFSSGRATAAEHDSFLLQSNLRQRLVWPDEGLTSPFFSREISQPSRFIHQMDSSTLVTAISRMLSREQSRLPQFDSAVARARRTLVADPEPTAGPVTRWCPHQQFPINAFLSLGNSGILDEASSHSRASISGFIGREPSMGAGMFPRRRGPAMTMQWPREHSTPYDVAENLLHTQLQQIQRQEALQEDYSQPRPQHFQSHQRQEQLFQLASFLQQRLGLSQISPTMLGSRSFLLRGDAAQATMIGSPNLTDAAIIATRTNPVARATQALPTPVATVPAMILPVESAASFSSVATAAAEVAGGPVVSDEQTERWIQNQFPYLQVPPDLNLLISNVVSLPPQNLSHQHDDAQRHSTEQESGQRLATTMPPAVLLASAPVAVPMGIPSDAQYLNEYQCYLRQQVYLFEAGPEEVGSNHQGRSRRLVLKQVGIICRYCFRSLHANRRRTRGTCYFPPKLIGLYQATQNMANYHLMGDCFLVPADVRAQLEVFKGKKERHPPGSGRGVEYWVPAAQALGIIETDNGLMLQGNSLI